MNFTQEQRYEIIEKIIKEGKGIEEILRYCPKKCVKFKV